MFRLEDVFLFYSRYKDFLVGSDVDACILITFIQK